MTNLINTAATVATHINVDTDAAFSAALVLLAAKRAGKHLELTFVRSGIRPDECQPDTLYVDVSAGIKGDPDAFSALLGGFDAETQAGLSRLASEIRAIDAGESRGTGFGLTRTIAAIRRAAGDAAAVAVALQIIEGVLLEEKERARAADVQQAAIRLCGGRVAITHDAPIGTNGKLFDDGCEVVIACDAFGIAAIRRDASDIQFDTPAVRRLIDKEDGWFIHPKGFMLARGTFKNPAPTPSVINPEDLARAIFAGKEV